jgi:hypothetical protein
MHKRKRHHTPESRRVLKGFEIEKHHINRQRSAVHHNLSLIQFLYVAIDAAWDSERLDYQTQEQFREWDKENGLDFVVDPVDAPIELKMKRVDEVIEKFTRRELEALYHKSGQVALQLASIVPIALMNDVMADMNQ